MKLNETEGGRRDFRWKYWQLRVAYHPYKGPKVIAHVMSGVATIQQSKMRGKY